ncbi:hypothetical protein [Sulfolobus sp. E11-6]|uniref:hypothetical protein n=1 Tax=Sulfolobus sp. E11-6 TaxID=2663020 RepID=UPI001295C5D4|nr:hypothetical protein [Sulfolobus sp. E11-6]QGA69233.1 hypothetical protein GFS33_11470 [Sulfolobus sp. E11-6]
MERGKLSDFVFGTKLRKIIFSLTFLLYFFFFQYADRLLLFQNIILPQGVNIVIDTSPPVPPSQMPYPLWGPFLSITTTQLDWAMTPLSLGISFILSFLVALNVTLYISLFSIIRIKSTHKLAASLGLLATSLSCSCELFTGLIGAIVSNIPFLTSIGFMDVLGELLTIVAIIILTISSIILASEIMGYKLFSWMIWKKYNILLASIFTLILAILPASKTLFLVSLTVGIIAGGIWSYAIISKKSIRKLDKNALFISMSLVVLTFVIFPFLNNIMVKVLSLFVGFLGYIGYRNLKSWTRLGLLHVIGWSLIMPGPISLILGTPISFYNITDGNAILFWISGWIVGTPIAWLAGVQYLQFIRDKMTGYTSPMELRLNIRRSNNNNWPIWVVLGSIVIISQIEFFITHAAYFLDYNGYDLIYLTAMTLTADTLIISGLVSIGYGVYSYIKSKFSIPKINKKYFSVASLTYGIVEMLLTKTMIISPFGYPYPPLIIIPYGEPMYTPAITVYIPKIIGFYLYPLSIISLIVTSLLAGIIWTLAFQVSKGKLGSITLISVITACPSCGLSALESIIASVATVPSVLLTTYGIVSFTIASVVLLTALLVYLLRKSQTVCKVDYQKRL